MTRITDAEVDAWGGYVRFLADQMRLRDWAFDVAYDEELAGSDATFEVAPNRRFALIRLSPRFIASPPDEQRYALVHELMHPHLHPLHECIRSAQVVLYQNWPIVESTHTNALESATHTLAAILSPYFPTFPAWHEAASNARLNVSAGPPEPKRTGRSGVPAPRRRN